MSHQKKKFVMKTSMFELKGWYIMEVEELFANLLNCGTSDWACLDSCNVDIREIAKEIVENEGRMPDLEDILDRIFQHGIEMMKNAVEDKIQELGLLLNNLSEKDLQETKEVLEKIEALNPSEDMVYYVNYLDSSLSIIKNRDVYEKYFGNTIRKIEDMTGYDIN